MAPLPADEVGDEDDEDQSCQGPAHGDGDQHVILIQLAFFHRPELVAFYLESLDPHFENVDRKGLCDPDVLLGVALVGIPHSGLECSQRVIGGLEDGLFGVGKSHGQLDFFQEKTARTRIHSKLEGKESAGLTLELQGHQLGSAAPADFGVIWVNVEHSGHSLVVLLLVGDVQLQPHVGEQAGSVGATHVVLVH